MAESGVVTTSGPGYYSLGSSTYHGNARPFHDYADNLATGHYDSRVKDLRSGLNSTLYAPQTVSTEGSLPTAMISTSGGRTDELLRVYPPSIHLNGQPVEYFPGNMGPRPATYPYEPIQTRSGAVYNHGTQSLLSTGTFAGRQYLDSGYARYNDNGLTSTRVDRFAGDAAAYQSAVTHRYAGPYTAALATGGARKVTLASFAPMNNSRTYGGTYTTSVGGLSAGNYAGVQPYVRQYAAPESYVATGGYRDLRSSAPGGYLPAPSYEQPQLRYAASSYEQPQRRVIPLSASYRPAVAAGPDYLNNLNTLSSSAAFSSVPARMPVEYQVGSAAAYSSSRPLNADESYA